MAVWFYPVFWIIGLELFSPIPLMAAESSPNLASHTITPREPQPAPLDFSFKLAAVCFAGSHDCEAPAGLGGETNPVEAGDYSSSELLCQKSGFSQTGPCAQNEKPGQYCGYNSSYYDRCCNKAYNYTAANCNYPNYLSSDNCSGKHKCLCDRRLYPVTSCAAPEILADANDYCKETTYTTTGAPVTTTYYGGCKCPDNYRVCGKNQVGVGAACRGSFYEDCQCATGFNNLCSDYGPKVGRENNFCSMGGIRYYNGNDCKTSAEVCSSKGFVTTKCGTYEEISETCPENSSYHKCSFSVDKYCTSNGYKKTACARYETTGASCSYDQSYHKCNKTCKSVLYQRYSEDSINTGVFYSGNTAYLTENLNNIPKTRGGTEYLYVYGAKASGISECSSVRPSVRAKYSNGSGNDLNRSFSSLNITLDHEGSGNNDIDKNKAQKIFSIRRSVTWKDVSFTEANRYAAISGYDKDWDWIDECRINNATLIQINSGASLTLSGSNSFSSGSKYSDNNKICSDTWFNNTRGYPSLYYFRALGTLNISGGTLSAKAIDFYTSGSGTINFSNNVNATVGRIIAYGGTPSLKFNGSSTSVNCAVLKYSGSSKDYDKAMTISGAKVTTRQSCITLYNARLSINDNGGVTSENCVLLCKGDGIYIRSGTLTTKGYASGGKKVYTTYTNRGNRTYISSKNCDMIGHPDLQKWWY